MSIKNNFALYFRNTYKDTNDTQMFDSETYDKLANFYLNYTKDDKKTSSKYPHFKYMKILTGDDVYSPNECEEEDKQVYLYNLYKNNHINKEIFVKYVNNPYEFFTSNVSWREFIFPFEKMQKEEIDNKLDMIKNKVLQKKFDFANYQYLYKRNKIGVILNYFKYSI